MRNQSKRNRQTDAFAKNKQKRKRERIILAILIPLFILILGGAVYGAKLLATARNTADRSFHEIDRPNAVTVEAAKEPTSILILGVDNNDKRQLGSTRTDSMIYLTMNPDTDQVNMVSIPRDTYTGIVEEGRVLQYNRINAAYAVGEEKAAIESVEHLLDVPVHYYVTVDFDAFMELVDALGGIDMYVPITFSENNAPGRKHAIHLTEGMQHLNGEEALALARTRKIDNDVKRGERQQLIIQAIIEKALKADSIPKYTKAIESVDGNIKTNMRMNDMVSIMKSGLSNPYTIHSHTFEWHDFEQNGAQMVKLDDTSLTEIQEALKESLERTSASNTHSLSAQ